MPAKNPQKRILFDSPGFYQITIRGRIDPRWSDRLEGMAIHVADAGADAPITTLEGELSDQAALAGVLNTLYELQMPVLVVMRLNI